MDDIFGTSEKIRVAILGSTGSVGLQTLDVVRSNPDRFDLVALAARSNGELLGSQAHEFSVEWVGLNAGQLTSFDGTCFTGDDAAARVAEESNANVVLNAVAGAAGLQATLATLKAGKILALANKESLVAAGELVMAKSAPGQIRPVDSEHSAMWQLLEGLRTDQVRKVVLTSSGGPFRGRSADDIRDAGVKEALAHPIWSMGRKITIDSATLMNKGLELIEAHFLFGLTYDEIEVLIHPQGIFHALVELFDGAVYAHAAVPDMRLPIQVALGWPERSQPPGGNRVDWTAKELVFEKPDLATFRAPALAYEVGRKGDTYPAVLNASNEVAVGAFLDERISFGAIIDVVERVLEEHSPVEPNLEGVLEQDAWARNHAEKIVESMSR